jgi:hypothetical protein
MRCLVALGLLTLAGCGLGEDEPTIRIHRADGVLLQARDLGPGYRQLFLRSLADHTPARVRYERTSAEGVFDEADSTVWVLSSDDAADTHLEAERERRDGQPIDEPGLGEESFAVTSAARGSREYRVYWREHNAAALLVVKADEQLAFSDVIELARKQEQRIADAGA